MTRFRFSRSDESQVDPFNAGEPELPGGEPVLLDEDEDLDSQVEYAPHGEPDGTPHKPEDDYQAPTTRGHDYDAPSIDGPRKAGRPRARRPRTAPTAPAGEVGARTEKDRRVVTRAIVLLVIVVSFGSSLLSCAAGFVSAAVEDAGEAVEGLGEALFGDDSDSGNVDWDAYVPEQDADDEAATAALVARLEALVSTPESGQLHDVVASYLDDKLYDLMGYSADELGVDTDAFATWALGGITFEPEYSYAYSDGTASSYAKIGAPDANEIVWAFHDATSDYRYDNDLWGSYGEEGATTPTEEQRSYLCAVFDEVVAAAEVQSPNSTGFDLALVDGAWVVDEQDLVEELESALDLY